MFCGEEVPWPEPCLHLAVVGVLEAFGVVEDLHDEGDGGDVSHVGGFGGTGTASDDPAKVVEDVGDARAGVHFGGEGARGLVGGNGRPV